MGAVYGFEVDIKVNWSDPYFNTLPYKTNDAQLAWIRTASHQIEKMMRKCFWKNREVNCSEYFTSTLTDMGFCYTLNSREGAVRHGGRPLLAGLTGSQNGLRVQLNAEQYEYTYSESNAAGFKVGKCKKCHRDEGHISIIYQSNLCVQFFGKIRDRF